MDLIAPPSVQPAPGPAELLALLELVGFVLHVCCMHLWYAGLPLATLWTWFGRSDHARRGAGRLGLAAPIALAVGLNLGLVPLLFVQVLWHRVVYPAGILMAWPWLAVIPLVITAYALTYVHSFQVRAGEVRRSGRAALTVAALLFVLVGFLFANHFSLMTHVDGWEALRRRTSVAGAVSGLALNTGDPTLLPRWLLFWGLGLTTAAVWVAVDALTWSDDPDYRGWALGSAAAAHGVGFLLFAGCGLWYFTALPEPVAEALRSEAPTRAALAGLLPVVPGVVLLLAWRRPRLRTRRLRWGLLALQAAALLANGAARHWVRDRELSRFGLEPGDEARLDASGLAVFLVALAVGVGLMVWLGRRVAADLAASGAEENQSP